MHNKKKGSLSYISSHATLVEMFSTIPCSVFTYFTRRPEPLEHKMFPVPGSGDLRFSLTDHGNYLTISNSAKHHLYGMTEQNMVSVLWNKVRSLPHTDPTPSTP
jgi:hypothetical protein